MTDLIISPVFTVAIDVTLLLAQTQQYRRIRCVSKTGAILQVDAWVCAEAGRVAASPGRVPGPSLGCRPSRRSRLAPTPRETHVLKLPVTLGKFGRWCRSHLIFFSNFFFSLKFKLQALDPQFETFFVNRSNRRHVKQESPFLRAPLGPALSSCR